VSQFNNIDTKVWKNDHKVILIPLSILGYKSVIDIDTAKVLSIIFMSISKFDNTILSFTNPDVML